MLHSRLLSYLHEVARSGSIRKAASRLNVAPSAISRQLSSLESELEIKIFERLPRRLRLTSAGELLIVHVRQTLKDHERFVARVEELKGIRRGEVKIIAGAGLAAVLLPRVVANFRKQYPNVTIHIRNAQVEETISALKSGDADLGLAFNPPAAAGVRTLCEISSRLGLVTVPGHPLTRKRKIRLSDCIGLPLILGDPSMTIRHEIDSAFASIGFQVSPVIVSNSIEAMKRSVMLGQGVTFLNEIEIDDVHRLGQLVHLPIADLHLQPQKLKILHRTVGALDQGVLVMAEAFKDELSHLNRNRR